MPKRFTATEKWMDPWFCGLPLAHKLFWIFLLDNCDHAGIWQVNWPLVKFLMGTDYQFDETLFGDRIKVLSVEKWFIPKFLGFQYSGGLNPLNKCHASIILKLEKEGATKPLASPCQGAKDKDKDKVIRCCTEGGMGETKKRDDGSSNKHAGTWHPPLSDGDGGSAKQKSMREFLDPVFARFFNLKPGDPDPKEKDAVAAAYRRFGRAGKEILAFARGNAGLARACVDSVIDRMDAWGLPCQLDTVAKWAPEYFANPEGFNEETEKIRRGR